jgi:putative inorganic carbon (HCO3(-)) transporter
VLYPHRLTYGPAYDFPFAMVIAVLTLVAVLFTKEHRKPKGGAAAIVLLVFLVWAFIANLVAFHPDVAFAYLDRVFKVFLMTFVLLLLIHTRKQVEALLWCLVLSLGFYGFKGGIFVIATGGNYMVMGPEDSQMAGNNNLGTGMVIILPIMYYLLQVTKNHLAKRGLMLAMALCAISTLGSYSRGALLALGGMCALLWLRGKNKVLLGVAVVAFVTLAIPFMPERWTARMHTIDTYEEDMSAMQRIWAWETAYNIAKDRFPLGGGFEFQSPEVAAKYSPNPNDIHVAHSIYFQVLGSLGFIGLALFLLFWWLVWRQATWLRNQCKGRPDLHWAQMLGSLVQVALVGYFIGGAFIDIAFWDLNYYLYAAVVGALYVVRQTLDDQANTVAQSPVQASSMALDNSAPPGMRLPLGAGTERRVGPLA